MKHLGKFKEKLQSREEEEEEEEEEERSSRSDTVCF